MKKTLLLGITLLSSIIIISQNSIELTYTALHNGQYQAIDSIFIENLSQGGDTILYAPDSVLFLVYLTGLNESTQPVRSLKVIQNYPNPFNEKTEIEILMFENENVKLFVHDLLGRKLASFESFLKQGIHYFTFYSGNEECYFISVIGSKKSKTIKLLNSKKTKKQCQIVYKEYIPNRSFKSALNGFNYYFGDELKYTAYSENMEVSIIDTPIENKTYTFEYFTIVCPDSVIDVDGNVYNTVLIGSQCWMKENLKTTRYRNNQPIPQHASSSTWQLYDSDGYTWYNNDSTLKDAYGALYKWYTVDSPDGLCPEGWKVPYQGEWNELINFIGGPESPNNKKLKSCRYVNSPLGGYCNTEIHPRWNENSVNYGTDDYGFAALPGGGRDMWASFSSIGKWGNWWTASSSAGPYANRIYFQWHTGNISNSTESNRCGYSVRCIKVQ